MSSFQNGSSPRSRNAAESDIEAGTSARRSDDLDGGNFSDPFDIARTKNASVERLRRWRVRFLFYFSLSDVLFIIVFCFCLYFCFYFSMFLYILNIWIVCTLISLIDAVISVYCDLAVSRVDIVLCLQLIGLVGFFCAVDKFLGN